MNANNIESKFAAMGARLKVREIASRWRQGDRTWTSPNDFAVDIQCDGAGEFFELRVPTHLSDSLDVTVMQSEPKQHLVEEIFRTGGETVHVSDRYPNGVAPDEYRAICQSNPNALRWNWRVMQRDAGVYARGTVRHSDHATITLPFWHRVIMNTETQSRTMANVAFLD